MQKLKIFLVEDDPEDNLIFRELLGGIPSLQFSLDWADNYASALEVISRAEHDVYFVDYLLGQESGIELLRAAKEKGCCAPMILVTGQGDHEVDLEGMRHGAADYLVKGRVDSDLLERTIRYALEHTRTQKDLVEKNLELTELTQKLHERNLDLVRMHHALEHERANYRQLFEYAPEGALVTDHLGMITDVNILAAGMFAFDHEALVGRRVIDLILEEDRAVVQSNFLCLPDMLNKNSLEVRGLRRDGSVFDASVRASPVSRTDEGEVIIRWSIRDISDRKAADKALIESAERIRGFAYSISHDLKQPAIALRWMAERLSVKCSALFDEQSSYLCDRILKVSREIGLFVDSINEFISTKQLPFALENVRVDELFQQIRDEYSREFSSRNVSSATVKYLVTLRADRIGLLRALRNLVDNALKYGGAGLNQIRLEYRATELFHILEVLDDGVGMTQEESRGMFDPFQRGRTSRGSPGVGLGLNIVQEIAEQHGGDAWAEAGPSGECVLCLSISKAL